MAGPRFAVEPYDDVGAVETANTGRDGTGTIVDFWVPDSTYGGKLEEIVLQATGDPADSIVTIFLYKPSTYYIYDEFDIGNPAAASTTVSGYRIARTYENLVLKGGHKMGAAITVALTAGKINVFGFGGNYVAR